MEILNKKGLTFVELLISITISVVIFIIIFSFVIDSIDNLVVSNKKAEVLPNFYSIYDVIWNYRNEFTSWSIIIDNPVGSWSDIALIKNIHNDKWIVFWIIDINNMKLENWTWSEVYSNKVFWYKLLSLRELTNIQTNTGEVFNISFDKATIFNAPAKTFQADFFNSWSIFLVDLELLISHNSEYDWNLWVDIPKSNYELFKLKFTF